MNEWMNELGNDWFWYITKKIKRIRKTKLKLEKVIEKEKIN